MCSQGTPVMTFKAFANHILSLQEHEDTKKLKFEKLSQNRFQISKENMTIKTVGKSLFTQLKDKSIYFDYGIISIPIEHLLLNDLRQHKKDSDKK